MATEFLTIRASAALRDRLKTTAHRRGQTITALVLEGIEHSLAGGHSDPVPISSAKVPYAFAASAIEGESTSAGYSLPGFHLAVITPALLGEAACQLVTTELQKLRSLLDAPCRCGKNTKKPCTHEQEVLKWFSSHLPSCFQQISKDKQREFVSGVRDAHARANFTNVSLKMQEVGHGG
jgi:hypothetical protein